MTYSFDVFTSEHDAVKVGVVNQVRSRVVISASEFPTYGAAAEAAACLAVAVHGGMPTSIHPRY